MDGHHVVVVGAGAGGLACAIDLAASGLPVLVLEAGAGPGGKLAAVSPAGRPIDVGPTVFTMKGVFEALAAAAGRRLEDIVRLKPLDVIARHAWGPNEQLDLFADLRRSADAVGRFAGLKAAEEFLAFHAEAARVFNTLKDTFITRDRTGPLGLTARVGPLRFGEVLGLRPYASLHARLSRRFEDPRLRQLFGRYATYCGSSPYLAPATLMLIAHVEQDGVFAVDGGMAALARGLAAVAEGLGVAFRYGARVEQVLTDGDGVAGVRLETGEVISARRIVFNGDPAALSAGRLGPQVRRAGVRRPFRRRSLSAVTYAFEARTSGFPLARHNVFFSQDYAGEFDALLRQRRLPADPTVYVCAQDRGEGADPNGAERLFLLVNAPATGEIGPYDEEELERCARGMTGRLEAAGLILNWPPETLVRTTPQTFETRYPATGGALYGDATHGPMAAFQRPGAKSRIRGLYLAGGAIHPGPGVPMAVLSGRIAALQVRRDLALTSRSPRGVTRGGMWTPSATTVGTA